MPKTGRKRRREATGPVEPIKNTLLRSRMALRRMTTEMGITPLKLIRAKALGEQSWKEYSTQQRVVQWLLEHGWACLLGTDPPDLVAIGYGKTIGIEVIAHRLQGGKLRRAPFYVSKKALEFVSGHIYFIIAVETAPGIHVPLVLSRDEMAAMCKGKSGDRPDRIRQTVPRHLGKWEQFLDAWDKLEER